jgi:hypothetical protein
MTDQKNNTTDAVPVLNAYYASYNSNNTEILEHICDSMNVDYLIVAESENDALEQLYTKHPTYEKKGFSIDATLNLKEKSIEIVDKSGCYDY